MKLLGVALVALAAPIGFGLAVATISLIMFDDDDGWDWGRWLDYAWRTAAVLLTMEAMVILVAVLVGLGMGLTK